MVLIDPELEHKDVFEAKVGAEIALNRIYAGEESYEELVLMTAAILNYWRKVRPYVRTKFPTYYDDLKFLDEVETKVNVIKTPRKYGEGYEEKRRRGVLSYEQGVVALQKLNEVYILLGYGKVKPAVPEVDYSLDVEEEYE
ncbi:MAG: hypothetical protein JRC90_10125 [Deltaproteobacteria bacterium]|nr:hypothetical protein [Deltaproteobacteria bacterium]